MNLKNLNYKKKYIIKIKNHIYTIKNNVHNIPLLILLKYINIHIPYQCQEGYCGTCKIRLIHGKVQYFKKNIIALKKKGYIFPCCCNINSNIEINI
ncbi:2Fe-2S iron-sulfur cluster-binding protein [Buchnera aphidicola]|uniref:2Fe-2S iron-sulfur cluster-binding protein n=1 Tax=Buchnera aphidicola TaxID=9 RepID=UPI003463D3F6